MIRASALKKELPASKHIPYAALVSPELVLTRSGDYVQTLKLSGSSFESADDDTLNNWHERLNVTWRNIASPNLSLWTHLIRRRASPNAATVPGDSFWTEVTVRGTERFRKEAWVSARLAGIEVRGYTPTDLDQTQLGRRSGREADRGHGNDVERDPVAQGVSADARSDSRGGLIVGTLRAQGRATYRNDPKESMSYFVKLETPRGERTVWGVDLERATRESVTRPTVGDEVALRAVRAESVKVKARDENGNPTSEEIETRRNRWVFEKRKFFIERARAASTIRDATIGPRAGVKSHPELVGTYLQVHAAELAAKRIRDPDDQKRFVQLVRSRLADSIARGEPLPAVRLKEPLVKREPKTPNPSQARVLG